ncbi:hypothetical protein V5O48_015156 [Marasmius crinis-equi]|uniref:RBR-type E3 ubiquitin transferase n=1 Tax=Marasmius crinis-equi TaxID=585013 RepID=A0ABR3EVB1_9AGAR
MPQGNQSLDESPNQVCPFFLKGRCKFGAKCKKSHVQAGAPVIELSGGSTSSKTTTDAQPSKGPDSVRPTPGQGQVSHPKRKQVAVCFDWNRGKCNRGDNCKFRHERNVNDTGVIARQSQNRAATSVSVEEHEAGGKGRSAKRKDVRESEQQRHREAEEQRRREAEEERLRREAEEQRLREAEEKRLREAEEERRREVLERSRREAQEKRRRELQEQAEARRRRAEQQAAERERLRKEAERRAEQLRIEEEARREERDRIDAVKTIQRLVLGSTIVKFSAGVNIDRILTGFDSCRVRVKDLPADAKEHEVRNLLSDQGIDEEMFQLVSLKMWKGKREANFIVEEESGRALALGLDGIDFRGQALTIEASDNGTLEGMHSNNSAVLSINWRIPSARFVATYLTPGEAAHKRGILNGRVLNGRKIRVEENRFRGGHTIDPYSLLINGVPLHTSIEDIQELFGTFTIRQLPTGQYIENLVEEWLKGHVRGIMNGGFVDFEQSQLNAMQGNRSLRVQFRTWEDAKNVHDQLANKKFPTLGNSTFRLWLPDPYQITISMQQYRSQKKQWDSFVEDSKNKKDSVLHVRLLEDKVILRVGGDDMKAVGMLKVRVESLVAGETLQDMWHTWFGSAAGQAFLGSVHTTTGAYIRHDWRMKVLKAYGDSAAISKAKEMMKEELERLSGLEHTESLKRQSIRFFVQRGVAALEEAFGEDSVTLDISTSPVRITVRGGEEARHLLRKLVDESLYNVMTDFSAISGSSCPICMMEVSNPVKLGCGHEYCIACIRHFFTADINNFPIVCVGDAAKCMQPIALPVIEKYLTPSQFNTLLETAFTRHIESNPQIYRYCNTPDCRQIYRCNSTAKTRQCPSCLAVVCIKCHEEGHDGMTCEERRVHADPAEQERLNDAWARDAGVKRCPSCRIWIEKTEGCNHMSCKCGAHICWVCMGVFPANTIYDHMNTAHGGIYEREEPMVRNEDVAAQLQAFQVYENQNQNRAAYGRVHDEDHPNAVAHRLALRRARLVEEARQQREAEQRRDAEARMQALYRETQARREAEARRLREQRDAEAMRQYIRLSNEQYIREQDRRRNEQYVREQERRLQQERKESWCVVM